MRRIYVPIILILCGLCFYWGLNMGESRLTTEEIGGIRKAIDSLNRALVASKNREQMYLDLVTKDGIKITDLQVEIENREKEQKQIRRYYEKRIKDIQSYSATELDSFFIKRYPSPGQHAQDTSVESQNDSTGLSEVRLIDERIQQANEGLQERSESVSVSGEPGYQSEVSDEGEGSTISDIGGESKRSNEIRIHCPEVQTTAEQNYLDWRGSINCRYSLG